MHVWILISINLNKNLTAIKNKCNYNEYAKISKGEVIRT